MGLSPATVVATPRALLVRSTDCQILHSENSEQPVHNVREPRLAATIVFEMYCWLPTAVKPHFPKDFCKRRLSGLSVNEMGF